MVLRIRSYSSEISSTADDICQEIKKTDFIRGVDRFYTMNGLDKISQALIPIFKLLQSFSFERLELCLAIARGQRDLYQGTLIIPWALKLIERPSISKGLIFITSIFKTAHVLVKYDLYGFESYHLWSNNLGQYPLFKYSIVGHWLRVPRDFFLFLSGAYEVGRISHQYIVETINERIGSISKTAIQQNAYHEIKRKAKKRKDLLNLISELGKMTLALLRGSASHWNRYAKLGFYALELGFCSVNLIRIYLR